MREIHSITKRCNVQIIAARRQKEKNRRVAILFSCLDNLYGGFGKSKPPFSVVCISVKQVSGGRGIAMPVHYSYIVGDFLSKKSCFAKRDILPMSMNTHII